MSAAIVGAERVQLVGGREGDSRIHRRFVDTRREEHRPSGVVRTLAVRSFVGLNSGASGGAPAHWSRSRLPRQPYSASSGSPAPPVSGKFSEGCPARAQTLMAGQ
jgi:hypothetical protein